MRKMHADARLLAFLLLLLVFFFVRGGFVDPVAIGYKRDTAVTMMENCNLKLWVFNDGDFNVIICILLSPLHYENGIKSVIFGTT